MPIPTWRDGLRERPKGHLASWSVPQARGPYASTALQKSGEKGGVEMSRRALVIALVAAVLLASVATPAIGIASKVHDAVPVQTETWSQFADGPDAWLVRVTPRGGCQSGGGGGCTV